MRKFDSKVQRLKYEALREVARAAWRGDLLESLLGLPKLLAPGPKATLRCCVHKERAIAGERVALAMGGSRETTTSVEVLDIACDECPASGYSVTEICRGCLAHPCKHACPKEAISFADDLHAIIDKSKCINCGLCAKACSYGAIINRVRPCERACKAKAISMASTGEAQINDQKCVSCGACSYQCPFGAIADKSSIVTAVELLKGDAPTVALLAPSYTCQFSYATPGQVVSGLYELGLSSVHEAALGADLAAWHEAQELTEKGFLTSSCCPAFVEYVRRSFPKMRDHISSSLSPMALLAQKLKAEDPARKVIFIGPCTAKKLEAQWDSVSPYVDCVLTFEELQALFDSRDLEIGTLPEHDLSSASRFGRGFARSGGLSEAIAQAISEQGLHFQLKPIVCSGLEECRRALMKAQNGVADFNFIEGMACPGGCIGGAGCLSRSEQHKRAVEDFANASPHQTISSAIE